MRRGRPCRSLAPGRAKSLDPNRRPGAQRRPRTPLLTAESYSDAGGGRLGGGAGLGPRRPNCAAAGPDPAAGAGAGDFKKSYRPLLAARAPSPVSRYRFIAAGRSHHPVRRPRPVLGVPARGHCAWQTGQPRAVAEQTPARETALAKAFGVHQRRDGTRRLQAALRKKGAGWAASTCARPCAAGACARNPRPPRRAPPTLPTGYAAPPTGCWTSLGPSEPTRFRSTEARICHWRATSGPTDTPSRTWASSAS